MNDGVRMLAARMESNPEEFWIGSNKWIAEIMAIEQRMEGKSDVKVVGVKFLTDEEVKYLCECLKKLRREEFAANITKKVMSEEEPAKGDPRVGMGMPSGKIGNLNAQQAWDYLNQQALGQGIGYLSNQHMQHIQEHQMVIEKERAWREMELRKMQGLQNMNPSYQTAPEEWTDKKEETKLTYIQNTIEQMKRALRKC